MGDVGLVDAQGVHPDLHVKSAFVTFSQVSQGRIQMVIHSRGNAVQEDSGFLSRVMSPLPRRVDVPLIDTSGRRRDYPRPF